MSERPKELELAVALLRKQSTLALATADEAGEACIAPLFYIADDELSLFWLSSETSQHSVNLIRRSRAAVTVYRHADNWKEIRGVQMRGTVSVITDQKHRREVVKIYCQRFKLRSVFHLAISQCALYVFRPEFIRYIDNSRKFGSKVELVRGADGEWKRRSGK
jgi:uncharacterized protein YhbP (UPF0306 family)